MSRDADKALLPLALCFLGACVSPTSSTSQLEPEFQAIEPFDIGVEYVWSSEEGGGFVARLATLESPRCYDIVPASPAVGAVLREIDHFPATIYDPPPHPKARYSLRIDAFAEIPASRAGYLWWGEADGPSLSSAPWYFTQGRQVFLSCTENRSAFYVYRVSAIEPL